MNQSSQTNVLLEVTSLSMRIGRKYVAPYSHRNSPQKFTQEQLLTCLILRAYLKTTYRGVIEVLEVSDGLRDRLGMKTLPHYSTLKKFALEGEEAAIDSTGMEMSSASAHFQSRSGKKADEIRETLGLCAGRFPDSRRLGGDLGPCNDKAEAAEVLAKRPRVRSRKPSLPMRATMPNGSMSSAGKTGRWTV